MVVVDDMDALPIVAPTRPGMGHDAGATRNRRAALIVALTAQPLPDRL